MDEGGIRDGQLGNKTNAEGIQEVKIVNKTEFEMTDAAVKKHTGRAWNEWFSLLDNFGGPAKGRREIGNYLAGELKVDPWWSSTIVVEYEAARGVKEKDGRPKGYYICVSKTIGAPADAAFAAFSSAANLDRWFGSNNKLNFSEGARFENAEGNAGTIKKIKPGKGLKFTWEDKQASPGGVVEITITPKGEAKCNLLVTHDRIQGRDQADGLRNGWGAALDALKNHLENGK